MTAAVDLQAIATARRLASGCARSKTSTPSPAPEVLFCLYEAERHTMRVVFSNCFSGDLALAQLEAVGDRELIAWSVDAYHQGVDLVLADGTMTSFSGDLVRYQCDPEYRRQMDERRGDGARRLAQTISERVRALRTERGWSVTELARRAGMAAPNIHRLEAALHVPTTATLVKVAEALEVPLEKLLAAPREGGQREA